MVWYYSGRLWHVKGICHSCDRPLTHHPLERQVNPTLKNEAVAYLAVKSGDNELKTLVVICGGVSQCSLLILCSVEKGQNMLLLVVIVKGREVRELQEVDPPLRRLIQGLEVKQFCELQSLLLVIIPTKR